MATHPLHVDIRDSKLAIVEIITCKALELSRTRKAEALLLKYGRDLKYYFDTIPSTDHEREADWKNAITAVAVEGMTENSRLPLLPPSDFYHFEGIWLENLKECLAYHNWLSTKDDPHCEATRLGCYLKGCNDLRDHLVAANKPMPPDGAIQYLRDTYLDALGKPISAKTADLVARKEKRLAGQVPNASWTARKFVDDFYSNVYSAITRNDREAVTQVLKAVENGGSAPGRPSIVNGFEALLLILFLEGTIVKSIWANVNSDITREATL